MREDAPRRKALLKDRLGQLLEAYDDLSSSAPSGLN